MKVHTKQAAIAATCLVFGCLYVVLFFKGVRNKDRSRLWDRELTFSLLNRIESHTGSHDEQTLYKHDNRLLKQTILCPYCGGRISFYPVAPSGDRILFYNADNSVASGRFYASCTNTGERGAFRFQFDLQSRPYKGIMTDEMVSWYFCRINTGLTDAEFFQENEYRKRIGNPILYHRTAKRIKGF